MKKKILGGIAILAIAAVAALNVSFSAKSNGLSDVSLTNIEALAEIESGNTKDCPGGSCSFSDAFGNVCTACCPEGKNPRCDTFGCTCS